MAKISVYLPDEVYETAQRYKINMSRLLRDALLEEIPKREASLAETSRNMKDLMNFSQLARERKEQKYG